MYELAQLDERRAIDEGFDVKCRECDEVSLRSIAARWMQRQESMTNLLDMDGSTKRRFLAVVALQLDAVLLVADTVGSDGRVM